MKNPLRSRAHTLIELMLAVALGILTLVAAVSLYQSQRLALTSAADAAQMRDAATAALTLLGQQIQMAGFVPLDSEENEFGMGLFGCVQARPRGVDGMFQCEPLAGGSDGIVVRYIGDGVSTWQTASGQTADCLGQGIGIAYMPALVVNRYYARLSGSTGRPELYCEGNGKPGVGQPLVEGIERLRFRYWLRDAMQPVDASMLAQQNWRDIVAVDICVQVRGALAGRRAQYRDCEGSVRMEKDKYMRTVLRRHVAVRNQVMRQP